jgi:L-lactate dehydrogenase (cytochrome)
VLGQRHCDIRNGMTVPPQIKLSNIVDIAMKPAWALSILRGKRRPSEILPVTCAGMEREFAGAMDCGPVRSGVELEGRGVGAASGRSKLVLKGVLDVEDAEEAAKTGAQALVVSNHGGRQLDGAPSSIEVLPEIVDAVGSQMEIMFDGGIRSGQDVVRALALGAKSCMIGRAYAYGLGAGGQAGVAKAIGFWPRGSMSMALCGVRNVERHRSQRDRAAVTDAPRGVVRFRIRQHSRHVG